MSASGNASVADGNTSGIRRQRAILVGAIVRPFVVRGTIFTID
jgi:hypothetical protein